MESHSVAEVMTANPLTTTPKTPITDVVQMLSENRISGLPVVDEQGALVGIISETDLLWQERGATPPNFLFILDAVIPLEMPGRFVQELRKVIGSTVAEVMTKNPVTIRPEQTAQEAARLMMQKEVHRLPVVDKDHTLVGIVTRGDIVRAMAR
jgi:CBS domain-containing protein